MQSTGPGLQQLHTGCTQDYPDIPYTFGLLSGLAESRWVVLPAGVQRQIRKVIKAHKHIIKLPYYILVVGKSVMIVASLQVSRATL